MIPPHPENDLCYESSLPSISFAEPVKRSMPSPTERKRAPSLRKIINCCQTSINYTTVATIVELIVVVLIRTSLNFGCRTPELGVNGSPHKIQGGLNQA